MYCTNFTKGDTVVTAHSTRFGLNLVFQGSHIQTIEEAKRAADVGFDLVLVPDHLGFQAPFQSLCAVSDSAVVRPGLLARDLATGDAATGGRLDIGLGAG